MTKPPTSVRSIRLPNDLWAALQAQADALGVSLNRYVALRLEGAKADARAGAKVMAPKPAPVARNVETSKPAPFKSRLKGEWKAP